MPHKERSTYKQLTHDNFHRYDASCIQQEAESDKKESKATESQFELKHVAGENENGNKRKVNFNREAWVHI